MKGVIYFFDFLIGVGNIVFVFDFYEVVFWYEFFFLEIFVVHVFVHGYHILFKEFCGWWLLDAVECHFFFDVSFH